MSQISKDNGRFTDGRRDLFREVNDRIVGLGGYVGGEQVLIHCECGSTSCEDRIELSREEYTELRLGCRDFSVMAVCCSAAVSQLMAW